MTAYKNLFKAVFLIILALIFLFTPKLAVADWVKYPGNPILSGTTDWWDSIHALCPSLIKENDIYKIWYTGHGGLGWRIGYASSPTGKGDWIKNNYPVIDTGSPDSWEKDSAHPFVLYEDGIYKMWYASNGLIWQSGSGRWRLSYATSPDGIEWNEHGFIMTGTPGSWDNGGINRRVTVIKTDSEYKMWYAGANEGHMGTPAEEWRIGYATSPDGIEWTKYPSNEDPQPVVIPTKSWELNSVSYPHVIYENGVYHMWYSATEINLPIQVVYAYSTDGINWEKPADQNPALVLGTSGEFDDVYLASPFVIREGNTYKMWYDGYDGSHWRIGYAEMEIPVSELQTLVLLPGLGGSWNFQSIVLGNPQPQSEWQMTPGITVYNGIIEALKNSGYQNQGPEQNLFVFNYDWTKPVSLIVNDLENYINNVVKPEEGQTIDLVGHSLGGLVARTYVQTHPDHQVDQLLTLGSPHHGASQVYFPWEGGSLSQNSPLHRIAIGLLIYLRRSEFATPKQTIQAITPVLNDLFPTDDFLKENGIPKPIETMIVKNNWLLNLNSSPPGYLTDHLNTFVGQIPNSTLKWIEVEPRSWLEKILGYWPDGRPTGATQTANGDETVLAESAVLDGAMVTNLPDINHRGLVQTTTGQEKVLEVLGLTPTSVALPVYDYEPTLVGLIASPAIIQILDSTDNPVGSGDGKLMIAPDLPAGEYKIKISGTGEGNYQLHLGQITANGDTWTTLFGSINPGEEVVRLLNFLPEMPLSNPFLDPSSEITQESVAAQIEVLQDSIQQSNLKSFIKKALLNRLKQISSLVNQGQTEKAIIMAYRLRQLITVWQQAKLIDPDPAQLWKNNLQQLINNLEKIYIKENEAKIYPQKRLKQELRLALILLNNSKRRLQKLNQQGKATPEDGALYLLAEEKLTQAQESSHYQAHIQALGSRYLSQEALILF